MRRITVNKDQGHQKTEWEKVREREKKEKKTDKEENNPLVLLYKIHYLDVPAQRLY